MGRHSIKKIKICVIGSSRATYGYKKNILKILGKDKYFDLVIGFSSIYKYNFGDVAKTILEINRVSKKSSEL